MRGPTCHALLPTHQAKFHKIPNAKPIGLKHGHAMAMQQTSPVWEVGFIEAIEYVTGMKTMCGGYRTFMRRAWRFHVFYYASL